MTGSIEAFNVFADAWAEAIWRACWQGGLAVVLVWGLCRLWRNLPPAMQCWLWRLVYVKFLVLLFWAAPIELALLPSRSDAQVSESVASRPVPVSENPVTEVELAAPADEGSPIPASVPPAPQDVGGALPVAAGPQPSQPTGTSLLALAWLLGVGWALVGILRAACRAWMLRRRARRVEDDRFGRCCADLCGRFSIHRSPDVQLSDEAGGPLLLGIMRPVILIPSALADGLSRPELRMILAHELAHLARRDLLWNWLPAVVHTLLYFHPLLWLARRDWRLAQETACDELVIRHTEVGAAAYGELLIKAATNWSRTGTTDLAAVGVVGTYRTLRRRLLTMKRISRISRRQVIGAGLAVATFALVGVVPWRLVAQETVEHDKAHAGRELNSTSDHRVNAFGDRVIGGEYGDGAGTAADRSESNGTGEPIVVKGAWVMALHDVTLASGRDAVIAVIDVQEGDTVKAGQQIARLRDGLKQAALEVRHAEQLEKLASIEYNKARESNKRFRGTVPTIEITRLENQIKKAQIVVEKAQAAYESLKQGMTIETPIDGVVAKVFKSAGEAIGRGDPIAEIVGTRQMRVEGYVGPKDLPRVGRGDPVTVQVDFGDDVDLAIEKEKFHGKIAFVSFKVDQVSGYIRVWAVVENRDKLLRPGYQARMTIHPSKNKQ